MKKLAIFIALWLCFTQTFCQKTVEKHISFAGKESARFDIQIADTIDIATWSKNEVYIKAVVNIDNNKLNDGYQISFPEEGNTVRVKANLIEDYFKGKKSCCNESEIRWQLFIPEKKDFSLETINGNITIRGETSGMKVKSISGFIDLAVPSSKKADIEFSTVTGTVYTDHTLGRGAFSRENSSEIKEKLNNGGPLIKLESVSGDIFFRKAD